MNSSTLFFLLTVFLVALTISVSAYPGEEKEKKEESESKESSKEGGEKGESKEGEKKEEKKEGEGKDKEKSGAMSLLSSSGFSAAFSLAIACIILSIH